MYKPNAKDQNVPNIMLYKYFVSNGACRNTFFAGFNTAANDLITYIKNLNNPIIIYSFTVQVLLGINAKVKHTPYLR